MASLQRGLLHRRLLTELAKAALSAGPGGEAVVGEQEVAVLPAPVQRYLRFMGVIGRPRDWAL